MKDKKIPYDNAELEVVKLSGEDLIATSMSWSGDTDFNGIDWS